MILQDGRTVEFPENAERDPVGLVDVGKRGKSASV